jgi:pilus assembly protein CpaF
VNVEVTIDSTNGARRVEYFAASEVLSIGRTPQCSVCVVDDLISRQHALVHLGELGLRVEDQSRNGTFAGGSRLSNQSLEIPYGTPIVVGSFTLLIRPHAEERAPSPVPPAPAQAMPAPAATEAPPHAFLDEAVEAVLAPGRRAEEAVLRREIHRHLLHHLDLSGTDATRIDDPSFRPRVLAALRRIIGNLAARLPQGLDQDDLIGQMADEALGLGPLEYLLSDPTVSEIMVIDADTIYVERAGRIERSAARFTDDDRVRAVIERIVTPLGRRIDESSPLVDARLPDGSRVNAIIRPLALKGSCITIRKFARVPLTLDKLYEYGALSPAMGRFLTRSVIAKCNIVISGGTGSGKTTLLNVLSSAIPRHERIVTIEDSAELQLDQPHVVALETRPANMEGKGEYTIRDLVKNSLRMRPDRIVVGECRGGEALDMLQAMNTGHDGSMSTVHANDTRDALDRMELMIALSGVELPTLVARQYIASAVQILVHMMRLSTGERKVMRISELCGSQDGAYQIEDIFVYRMAGIDANGRARGAFYATGYEPQAMKRLSSRGQDVPSMMFSARELNSSRDYRANNR